MIDQVREKLSFNCFFMMQKIVIVLFLFVFSVVRGETYYVAANALNVRFGPSAEFSIVGKLVRGDTVSVMLKWNAGWWQVDNGKGVSGYVYSRYLSNEPVDDCYASGTTPECMNITPMYDYDIDNYLKIKVGTNADVVVKLMDEGSDKCIRCVYIRSNDTYYLRNIPEGVYYLKIAYGKGFKKFSENGMCYMVFTKNALYEIGDNRLDYNFRWYDELSYDVPSYELFLDVEYTSGETFNANNISESEFNQ